MRMVPLDALFVTQYYKPELIGSGPSCADVAEWLAKHGRRVTVLTGFPRYPLGQTFPDYDKKGPWRETLNGVLVERLSTRMPRSGSALSRILGDASFLLAGIWAIARGRVSRRFVVLSLCPSILSVALGVLARRRGGRHIAIVHDIQSGLAEGLGMVGSAWLLRVMRWCERVVLNKTDLIAVLTHEMRQQLRRIGVVAPIEVMPIWVDTSRISPTSAVRHGPPRVQYSGNLGKKQGLGQVIALAEELQRRSPEIELVVRGNGSRANDLLAEVAVRGLKNVRVLELLPRENLSQGLAQADVHLIPQDPDAAEFAVPSKIFSVMAAGRPSVATARPGSPLWNLREQSGAFLCAPPNDAQAFADAVLRLTGDERLRAELGLRGRRFVEQHCSKPKVLGELLMLIDGLYAAR